MNLMNRLVSIVCLTVLAVAVSALSSFGQQAKAKKKAEAKPSPDMANVSYGPHERNVMDVWKAKSDQPTPLLVFIHGGGFRGGSKEALQPYLLSGCLADGFGRGDQLSPLAGSEVSGSLPRLCPGDSICPLESEGLEPRSKRVAASGGSAGAGTSLWLGFHDDLADPKNADLSSANRPGSRHGRVRGPIDVRPATIKKLIGGAPTSTSHCLASMVSRPKNSTRKKLISCTKPRPPSIF